MTLKCWRTLVRTQTVHEVFNEIMQRCEQDLKEMSDIFKIQLLRAVGVAIVKHGNMYREYIAAALACCQNNAPAA